MRYAFHFCSTAPDRAATRTRIAAVLTRLAATRRQGDQFLHDHPHTDVQFHWTLPTIEAAPLLTLTLDACRPTIFVTEALAHITHLLGSVPLTLVDPQQGLTCPPDQALPVTALLAGYIHNAAAVARDLAQRTPAALPHHRAPRAKLMTAWHWNAMVSVLQSRQTTPVTIPRIQLLPLHGAVHSAVTWSDGGPIHIPKVDRVILHRQHTAPRQGFLARRPAICEILTFDDFLTTFGDALTQTQGTTEVYACQDDHAARIAARPPGTHFRADGKGNLACAGTVPMSQVLDAEFFA